MSMALVCLGNILLLINPLDVELSVWVGFLGCSCLNSSMIIQMYTASWADM